MTQPTIYSNNIGRHVPLRDLPWSELHALIERMWLKPLADASLELAVLNEHSRRRAE